MTKRKIIPFVSWFNLHLGNRGYEPGGGSFITDAPIGVRLEIEEAEKSEPVFRQEKPWEKQSLSYVQLKKDSGRYRMWYGAVPGLKARAFMCYAESDDGFNWKRPDLGLIEFEGSNKNNICHTGRSASAPSVFVDPSAKLEERYKNIAMAGWWEDEKGNELPSDEGIRRFTDLHREQEDNPEIEPNVFIRGALLGATSPDGLRWTEIKKPLLDYFCDTHNIACYDSERKVYVGYLRSHGPHGRSIGYSETTDFKKWPAPRVILHADPQDPPDVDLYSNCYCSYPGCEGIKLMFPSIYHHIGDHVDVRLAVSPNGLNWVWPERRPIIPCGRLGKGDEGSIYTGPDLVRFKDGKLALIYHALTGLHNEGFLDSASRKENSYRWAIWQKDRLAGIRADQEGSFSIKGLGLSDGSVHLNYRTEAGGWIKAELVRNVPYPPQKTKGIKGYCFEDCEILTGDELDQEIVWKGSGNKKEIADSSVCMRIKMFRAKIFGVMS